MFTSISNIYSRTLLRRPLPGAECSPTASWRRLLRAPGEQSRDAKNNRHLLIASCGACAVDLAPATRILLEPFSWVFLLPVCVAEKWDGMLLRVTVLQNIGLHDGLVDTDSWKIISNVFVWTRLHDFFNEARSNNGFTITWYARAYPGRGFTLNSRYVLVTFLVFVAS